MTKPTDGLLTIPHLDCISSQVSSDQAQIYYDLVYKGSEKEAFRLAQNLAERCKADHLWSDNQTRHAFRVSVMDGWLLKEKLIEKIQNLGDFRPFLDQYYNENVKPDGRQILEDVFESGQLDKDLTAIGYPIDRESRELAYNYWEWRGALRDIEDDFRKDRLSK